MATQQEIRALARTINALSDMGLATLVSYIDRETLVGIIDEAKMQGRTAL
jgi:hypothetical protein